MKYLINLEKIEGTDLYKACNFNTLVFDKNGISKLEEYKEEENKPVILEGDLVKTKNGETIYRFAGLTHDGECANLVNVESGKFTSIPFKHIVLHKSYHSNLLEIITTIRKALDCYMVSKTDEENIFKHMEEILAILKKYTTKKGEQ